MMKFPMVFTAWAAVALSALSAPADSELLFVRALEETDPARRGEALLTLAERRDRTAELALVYLTRGGLPPNGFPRLAALARARRGELLPAVLLVRSFRAAESADRPEPMASDEFFELVSAAWNKTCRDNLTDFERKLYRELSGEVLKLAWEGGATARIFAEVERRLLADGWKRDLPLSALLEYCYRHAFVHEGFELYSEAWRDSPLPGRRAFAALLEELPRLRIEDDAEAEACVRFLSSVGSGDAALLLAAERLGANGDASRVAPLVNQLVHALVESGRYEIFDKVNPLLNPAAAASVRAATLVNGGKVREALALLPQIGNPVLRANVELRARMALGEFSAAAALANDPKSPLPLELRIFALLEIAESRRDGACYDAALRLAGDKADTDPGFANGFGYVGLLLGRDREQAERRIAFALSRRPRNDSYLDSMAWARHLAGDEQGAWKYMAQALRFADPEPEACELLAHAATIRLALGDRAGARKYCESALKLAEAGERSPRKAGIFRPLVVKIRKQLEGLK